MGGYLSPCGCTKPMSGGIKRRATAVHLHFRRDRTVILENGGFVASTGRQDELKAETAVEILRALGVTAINVTASDARLGRGLLLSLNSLSDDRFVSTSISQPEIQAFRASGPFLIGGATTSATSLRDALGAPVADVRSAAGKLVEEAKALDLVPILMLDGNRQDAVALAKDVPGLRLIQYQALGAPQKDLEVIGRTALVTPGEKGRHVVRLQFSNGEFSGYMPINLLPNFKDDPVASRLYKTYLNRVSSEKLLEKLPRSETGSYAGTAACGSCHKQALAQWKKSQHAHALKTLEVEGEDRDPDCVSCHVVGLESKRGFKSRVLTPQLANVGCESCHGPGKAHAAAPKKIHLGKVGEKPCLTCHTSATSPGFDYKAYWRKIAHK
jgi:hypothetical protein